MTAKQPITVVILSRNRPIYLWACLDSLYRYTRHPARFILTDNASDDPLIRDVVHGFERRGMFYKVEWHAKNDPTRVLQAVRTYMDGPGGKIVVIESDVTVFETEPCWLERMSDLMDENPELGLLGSYVDTRDFIAIEDIDTLLPDTHEAIAEAMIKARSPERALPSDPPDGPLIDPFNPPGRLLMARKSALSKLMFSVDGKVYQEAKKAGIRCAIATTVMHRHLSLLNAYDYRDYNMQARNRHFRKNREPQPVLPKASESD
ncbi:hypothetical protein [Roseovarius aestuariivivens]|uniref:hypothetical protein n=1 Tax=Roseovarius aestuariivivens TaxID=1888910 RepID=UPI0010820647|nr:hypothetical protein [Roseovarius aestuariivivens]